MAKTTAKIGRPRFRPRAEERKLVRTIAGYGVPQKQIASQIRGGISIDTLRYHFKEELSLGRAQAQSRVMGAAFDAAVGRHTVIRIDKDGEEKIIQAPIPPSVPMNIWYQKTQMGFREEIGLTGADGKDLIPEPKTPKIDWSKIPREKLAEIRDLLATAMVDE